MNKKNAVTPAKLVFYVAYLLVLMGLIVCTFLNVNPQIELWLHHLDLGFKTAKVLFELFG